MVQRFLRRMVVCTALMAPFFAPAQTMGVPVSHTLSIRDVSPSHAAPGDYITIVFTEPIGEARVTFGEAAAEVKSNVAGVLYVRVPNLEAGQTPPIYIATSRGSAAYVGFSVAAGASSPAPQHQRVVTPSAASRQQPSLLNRVKEWIEPVMPGVAAVAIAIGAAEVWRAWHERRRLRAELDQARFVNESARSDFALPESADGSGAIPDVPKELVQICASGNCLLFAGPGLAAQAGCPTRFEALERLVRVADLNERVRQEMLHALRNGQTQVTTDVLVAKMPRWELISQLMFMYVYGAVDQSEAHRLLGRMPFAGVLTTGWDNLLRDAFLFRKPVLINGDADARRPPKPNDFYVARLHGDLLDESSVVFSAAEARDTLSDRPALAKFVGAEVVLRPVFFVGMSLSGIEEFFTNFRFRARSTLPMYALVPFAPFWEAQRERFAAQYGVQLIGYQAAPGHPAFATFISNLGRAVGAADPRRRMEQVSPRLARVRLTNIGAFETLDLKLNNGWNLILGNNGSGKSTILRAIGLGLCGDDSAALAAGQRLLRQDASTGAIELTVGDVVYETVLRRERKGKRVTVSGSLTPLQQRDWAVLGFPPLRGVSTSNPAGPARVGSPDPEIADVLPVIRGGIDSRLDSIKQWLVNIDVNSDTEGPLSKLTASRNRRLRDSFFSLLNNLVPGQSIRFGHVDRETWQAYVVTEDGEIPIDDVSQGMGSMLGWAGTLLQRLYEIHGEAEKPAHSPALVLIDEIDAHLHPEWQQKLVDIVKHEFPNLQVVATSHSPLIVAGMRQDELLIAARDPENGRVAVSRSLINPVGLRADQVLTTPLFGLQTTRSPEVARKIREYADLFGRPALSPDEKARLEELKKSLSGILLQGETQAERDVEQAADAATAETTSWLVESAGASSPDAKEKLRKALREGDL
jgi:energy-coupling factor transporter ATP-binding protein EcfA2